MLTLKGIEKFYKTGDGGVLALKGIDINFRRSEFVSVLGPSGCGKTTLLNIIGGLDHYTAGEMSIDGISTKEYGDRDWDTYRNERIGFVFQSYNLIPQQTIQGNVELALTIAGVSRQERARRAREALDKVGLAGLYNKKPNQLSGGQCQRVAIARALVNEPEILLADEPTGALDTATSVQIMDLIKEVAGDKLVIMVTHNPELARQYSTRIVELLDGKIVGDSNPYTAEECARDVAAMQEEEASKTAQESGEESGEEGGEKQRKLFKKTRGRGEKTQVKALDRHSVFPLRQEFARQAEAHDHGVHCGQYRHHRRGERACRFHGRAEFYHRYAKRHALGQSRGGAGGGHRPFHNHRSHVRRHAGGYHRTIGGGRLYQRGYGDKFPHANCGYDGRFRL